MYRNINHCNNYLEDLLQTAQNMEQRKILDRIYNAE